MTSEQLIQMITEAFSGVTLGEGTGLWEAQAADDYRSATECRKAREGDEKDQWSRISVETLHRCESSLSFFDPLGMRFHLPAFLIAEIRGKLNGGVVFHLYHTYPFSFTALSTPQRTASRAFLN